MYIPDTEWKSLVTLVAKAGAVVTDETQQYGNDGHTPLYKVGDLQYKINDLHAAFEDLVGATVITSSDLMGATKPPEPCQECGAPMPHDLKDCVRHPREGYSGPMGQSL